MQKNLSVTGVCAALSILAGCAATGVNKSPPVQAAVAQSNPSCLTSTGSRLPATTTDCAAIGRSYSREDIERTGAPTVGAALPLLDPIFTVQH